MIIRNHKTEPLRLTPEQIASIQKKAGKAAPPTRTAKVKHAAQAVGRVMKAAARREPIRVSEEDRDRRLSICRACEYWNEGGNIGLGECTHAGCGCTRFKHGLATETCPLKRW